MTAIDEAFEEHGDVVEVAARTLTAALELAADVVADALGAGGTVFTVGNGGSAADAQHLASELVGRFIQDRPPWRAVALTVDSSALTSISNDYGFEHVFERQVEALARPGDVLIAISTSGTSPNVVAAARTARRKGCRVVGLTGADPAGLGAVVDLCVAVPSTSVPRIQEVHGLCVHAIVARIEERATVDVDDVR